MRAALYVRVSSQKQAEKWSLPSQRKLLAAHATKQGWSSTLYDEGAASGETIADRPVMRRLLADVASGRVDVVLVIEWERLCRASDLIDLATITGVCRKAGVLIATPERVYNLAKAEDDFESDLRGILSKREKRKILERCARGRAEAQDAGRYLGGTVPRGYRYDRNIRRLVLDPEMAPTILEIFTRPEGSLVLSKELQRRGIPVSDDGVRYVRRNPVYTGRTRDTRGKLIQGDWEPIVPVELWQRWQGKGRTSVPEAPGPYAVRYLLTGLVRCAACGGPVTGSPKGGEKGRVLTGDQHSYVCRRYQRGYARPPRTCLSGFYVRGWTLDLAATHALREHVSNRKRLREGYETLRSALEARSRLDPGDDTRKALRAQQTRRARVLAAIEEGLPLPEAGKRLTALTSEIERLEKELSHAQSEELQLPSFASFTRLAAGIRDAAVASRKAILAAFLREGVVDLETRRLTLRWLLDETPAVYQIPTSLELQRETHLAGSRAAYAANLDGSEWRVG
jgi:DNA invertase Pin-like site-specific DNA recombinase